MSENRITNCNICGLKTETVLKLKFNDIIGMFDEYTQCVNICPRCGFIYTENPFSDKQLANRYKNNSKYEFDSKDYFLQESESYKKRSLRQHQMLERELSLKDVHSVLEIGAASGYNLSLYNEGRPVLGIEPSELNCKSAKKIYGVDMFCGTFAEYLEGCSPSIESCGGICQQYDLILLSHVLEHIVNPSDFIESLSCINKKYIFIEVPTMDYKLIDEPYGMFCEEHVNIFTLESLQNLMNKNGYELIHVEMIGGYEEKLPSGWPAISTIWKKCDHCKKRRMIQKASDSLNRYIAASEEEFKRIRKIIDNISENKRLAIWGTGHHVSMLLANTYLKTKNIVAVYDSDIHKKGYTLNGIEIRPFDSNDLKSDKVDAVFIATYTAQNAIEKLLEPYKEIVEIIKLYEF